VPRGYVHWTSTDPSCTTGQHSVHLTLGLETETVDKTYADLVRCVISRHRAKRNVVPGMTVKGTDTPMEEVMELITTAALKSENMRRALPLGFLQKWIQTETAVKEARDMIEIELAREWPEAATLKISDRDIKQVLEYLRKVNKKNVAELTGMLNKVKAGKLTVQQHIQAYDQYGDFASKFLETSLMYCGYSALPFEKPKQRTEDEEEEERPPPRDMFKLVSMLNTRFER